MPHRRLVLRAPPQRHCGRDRPTASARPPIQDLIVGLEPLDGGGAWKSATGEDRLRRPEPRGHRPGQEALGSGVGGTDYMMVGETEVPLPLFRGRLVSKGSRPAEARGRALRRRAQPAVNLALTLKERQPAPSGRAHQRPGRGDPLQPPEAALLVPGCSVVVSHDRMFLDRIATHILAWEGDDENPGRWHFFEGNFEAYQADREASRQGGRQAPPPPPQTNPRLGTDNSRGHQRPRASYFPTEGDLCRDRPLYLLIDILLSFFYHF